jgi:iron complex transport system permease protein
MTHRRRRAVLIVLSASTILFAFLSLAVGPMQIELWSIADAICDGVLGREFADLPSKVVWIRRLPTMLTALLAGASLGAAGLLMQTFFRNPLAGPDVMGVSAGASLGVALVTLLGRGDGFLPQFGFLGQLGTLSASVLGAAAVLGLALLAARWYDDPITLLVLGIMFAAAATGAVGLLVNFTGPDRLRSYMQWTLGSFDGSWEKLPTFAGTVLIGIVASLFLVKPLNVLQLGGEFAQALGVRLVQTRMLLLGVAALLAGVTTAICGPIAFLGIAAPHLARVSFRTSDHRWLMPASIVIGAALALAIDLAAKTLACPVALPINTVSGVLGAPLVIWVVIRLRTR